MKKFLYILVLLFSSLYSWAQDPHFSQFFASPLTLNPAYTGKFNGLWRLAVNHRDQWPTIPKAYVTTSASFDFPILKNFIPAGDVFGIGISGLSDASADNILRLNYGSLSLSYHRKLDEEGYNTIGAGFQGSYSSSTLDVNRLTFEDELTRNGFASGTSAEYHSANPIGTSTSYFDFNAGVLYSGSSNGINNYYAGVSMYHINRPQVSFRQNSNLYSAWYLTNRFSVHAGGSFPISDKVGVNISAIEQIQNSATESVIGGALSLKANDVEDNPTYIYGGAWVRLNDAVIPYLGLEFNGMKIGLSYDVTISDLRTANEGKGGAEFSIIYIKKPVEIKDIPCPKF